MLFKGKSFCIFGFPSKKKFELQEIIKKNGGTIAYSASSKTDYLLTTPAELSSKKGLPVVDALSLNIPIVREGFVFSCVDSQKLHDPNDYLVSLVSDYHVEVKESAEESVVENIEASQPMEVEKNLNESVEMSDSDGLQSSQSRKRKAHFDVSSLETNENKNRAWRTANVFISSTFKDMHGERDWLTRRVFPELQERCNTLRVQVCPVDLRWGITEETAQALEICLEEVDNCRPFFLGMLGERYGWVNNEYGPIADLPKFEWLKLMPPKCSITHLEMEYGVMKNPSASRYLFLLRNPAVMNDISYQCLSDFEPESEHAKNMMKLLKSKIRETCASDRVFTYPCKWKGVVDNKPMVEGLEQFGDFVLNRLWDDIQKVFGGNSVGKSLKSNEMDIARSYHERFVELQAKNFVGRTQLIEEIKNTVPKSPITVVVGEPGSGKSALVATCVKHYLSDPTIRVVYHFIGAAPGSTDVRRMILRICKELNSIFFDNSYDVKDDFTQLKDMLVTMLKALQLSDGLLLVFDALNQLDDTYQAQDLDWLPSVIPDQVRILISVLEGTSFSLLEKRSDTAIVRVGGLTNEEKRELVETKLWEYRKKLDEKQMNLLLSKTDSYKPLYLFVACEELRVFGVYEKLQEKLVSMANTVPKLFGEVLARLEQDHGWSLVQEALCLLNCARGGLLEVELLSILGEGKPLPRSVWSSLYLSLRPYLRPPGEDGQGLLDFFHRQLSKAIKTRYLDKETELKTHRQLAAFFHQKADPAEDLTWTNSSYVRSFNELPYHQMKSQLWHELEKTLRDLAFIEIKCAHGLTYELVNDYLAALDQEKFVPSKEFKEFARFVQSRAYVLHYAPYLTFTTALSLPDTSAPSIEAAFRWNSGIETRPYLEWLHKPKTNHPCLMTLTGHTFPVRSGVFSPASGAKIIASASDDKTVKLWNSRTGAETKSFRGHTESVLVVCFSPNGKYLLSGSWDKSWILWDVKTGAAVHREEKAHKSVVNAASFFSNGDFVTGSRDGYLKTWSIRTYKNTNSVLAHAGPITCCCTIEDIVVSSSEDKTIAICKGSTQSTSEIERLSGHTKEVVYVAVSPNGKLIASASLDRTLKIWDFQSKALLGTMSGHNDGLCSCVFSPDNKYVVSTSHDNIIILWDATNFTQVSVLSGHTGSVFTAAFSLDGAYILTTSFDRTLKVWDMESVKVAKTQLGHDARILGSAFANSGKFFATTSRDKTTKVWETYSGKELASLVGHKSNVLAVTFAPYDDEIVVTVSRDSTMKMWNWKHNKELMSVVAHKGKANYCDFSPHGDFLLSCGDDKTVKIWDNKMVLQATLFGHRAAVTVCKYSPDSKKIASGGEDFTVKLWDAVTHSKLATFSKQMSIVNSLVFSPDSKSIVIGCDNGKTYEYNASNGKLVACLEGHTSQVRAVAYSHDGKHLITGSTDSQVIMWNTTTKQRDSSFACLSRVTTLNSFPLDRSFVVGDGAGQLYILRPIGLPGSQQ